MEIEVQEEIQEDAQVVSEDVSTEEQEIEDQEIQEEVQNQEETEESEDVIVSIGDEEPEQEEEVKAAPEWVRELRKKAKETQRENKELKARIEKLSGTVEKPVELGKKPTLEDCDYDSEVFEQNLENWYNDKIKYDNEQSKKKAEQEKVEHEYQNNLNKYEKKKAELKVKDFEEAEYSVKELFSPTQQGMIVQGADDPALVVYALGKNPKKLKELSEIKDPVKFAFTVAKLETQMKITTRKATTKPERVPSSGARNSGGVDSELDRLRSEAEKTGDYSKVIRYKKRK